MSAFEEAQRLERSRVRRSGGRWLWIGSSALGLTILVVTWLAAWGKGVYSLSQLGWAALGFPIALALVALLDRYALEVAFWQSSSREKIWVLAVSIAAAALLAALFPAPLPNIPQQHHFQITVLSGHTSSTSSSRIEILRLTDLFGNPIPVQSLDLSGNWKTADGELFVWGEESPALDLTGPLTPGVNVRIKFKDPGGKIRLAWDGKIYEEALYATPAMVIDTTLRGINWRRLPLGSATLWLALQLLYLYGLLTAVALIVMVARRWMAGQRVSTWIQIGLGLAFVAGFVTVKLSSTGFDTGAYFRDTYSYAAGAEIPLTSLDFWAGERSFTLPLAFKLLGINTQNDKLPEQMARVGLFQIWVSIGGWLFLAYAISRLIRQEWLRLATFGLVLLFSLSYEIGKWDPLLLSESISFSLFAVLLAGWIGLISLPEKSKHLGIRIALLAGLVLVTVLYSFTRDTNLYFLVLGAAGLAAAAWFFRAGRSVRVDATAYLVIILALFFAQNATINRGNRWQIHIYDHLAYRIIPNAQALDYFTQAGLPISDQLLQIPKMRGAEYQALMLKDPSMAAVRAWTNAHGKATYLGYLLSHPRYTLGKPILDVATLLGGTGLDYRSPVDTTEAVSPLVLSVSRALFPTAPRILYGLIGVILLGISLIGLFFQRNQRGWWLVAILLLSAIPLLFIVWHGNPMEIARHADQIAIQVRLAGWAVLMLGLDWLASAAPSEKSREAAKVSMI